MGSGTNGTRQSPDRPAERTDNSPGATETAVGKPWTEGAAHCAAVGTVIQGGSQLAAQSREAAAASSVRPSQQAATDGQSRIGITTYLH